MQTFKYSSGQPYCNMSKVSNEIFAFKVDQLKQATWCMDSTQNISVENVKDLMQSLHCSMGFQKKTVIEVVFKGPRNNPKWRVIIILEKSISNSPVLFFQAVVHLFLTSQSEPDIVQEKDLCNISFTSPGYDPEKHGSGSSPSQSNRWCLFLPVGRGMKRLRILGF